MSKLPLVLAVCATVGMSSFGGELTAQAQSRARAAAVARTKPVARADVRPRAPKARVRTKAANLSRTRSPNGNVHNRVEVHISRGIRRGDAVERAKLIDYFRRINTTAELMRVLEGRPLSPVMKGKISVSAFLDAGNLHLINTHLDRAKLTFHPIIQPTVYLGPTAMTGGEIGFRLGSHRNEDRPFAFEIRSEPGDGSNKRPFIDAVLTEVNGGTYGSAADAVEAWHKANVPTKYDEQRGVDMVRSTDIDKQGSALASLHYNRPVRTLLEQAPAKLKPQLTRGVKRVLRRHAVRNHGLKMLIHDWSRDPALAGKPHAVERIVRAQQDALRALPKGAIRGMFAGKERYESIVRNFVAESGLTKIMADSVGVDLAR